MKNPKSSQPERTVKRGYRDTPETMQERLMEHGHPLRLRVKFSLYDRYTNQFLSLRGTTVTVDDIRKKFDVGELRIRVANALKKVL